MKKQLPELTIGIEEEYQIIDPDSRELKDLTPRGRVFRTQRRDTRAMA